MKYNKTNLLAKVLLIGGIVLALYLLNSVNEGFQGSTVVDLYFREGTTSSAPTFVSSTNPGVTFVSGAAGGTAVMNIAPSLGSLKDFKARGFAGSGSAPGVWTDIACVKINRGTGAGILNIESNGRVLHKTIPYTPTGSNTACDLNTSTGGLRLPQQVSTITIKSLIQGTFANFKTGGDTTKGGAKIHVQLVF